MEKILNLKNGGVGYGEIDFSLIRKKEEITNFENGHTNSYNLVVRIVCKNTFFISNHDLKRAGDVFCCPLGPTVFLFSLSYPLILECSCINIHKYRTKNGNIVLIFSIFGGLGTCDVK